MKIKKFLFNFLQNDTCKEIEKENLKLQSELIAVRSELKQITNRPYIDMNAHDPIPDDREKRVLYVAAVAGSHKDIYGPKILRMISDMREEFEKVNRETFGYTPKDYDLYLKGAINGYWLIFEWGERMINEQISNQQENIIDEDELEELKELTK